MKYFQDALIVLTLAKLLYAPDFATVLALAILVGLSALAKFDHAKEIEKKVNSVLTDVLTGLNDARNKFASTSKDLLERTAAVEKLEKDFEDVKRTADETKKLLTAANVGLAFRPRVKRE